MKEISFEERQALQKKLAATWDSRASQQRLKPGTVKWATGQLDFFLGAHATLKELTGVGINELILVVMASGRPASDIFQDKGDKK